ncbi:flagellar basal-body MS-ring/collar protein FliF [Paenibacillus humicola]|uniref:flagellar basal-body MS-ring/collar protein FliF n=1 Tax=Paenibacillus humicola TaxID=3110540 RepID=UPI00237B42AF|nr:flagellar basal-body MS-ring/collar protein FliF [Paenibacillus humicola]
MNEKFVRYRQAVAGYWNRMGKSQKIWLGASAGVLLLTVILLTAFFSRTHYELAFQNLDNTDAAAVLNYLDGNKIPYRLTDGGQSILVPAAEAAKVKVEAGSEGLVQNGSIGFDAFNDGSSMFGSTDREFDVKYRNALNGEIQKLLNGMQGVEQTKVLVNLPEESVFLSTDEKDQASASIMMTFKPGYRPAQKEIDGYYNLVKTAVPNLSADNITITSPQGELLASGELGGAAGATALETHLQIQRKYELDLKQKIQQFLGPIVGQNNLVVNVSSSINFDKKTTDEHLVTPLDNNNNNGIIVSEQQDNKTATGSSGAGGVAGTGQTDIPTYQAADGSGTTSSEENSRTTNYEFNRINNQIESGPYVIQDLSVSVGIEQSRLTPQAKADINAFLTSLVRSQLAGSGQNVSDDTLIAKKVSVIGQTFADSGPAGTASGLSTAWMAGIGLAAVALIGGLGYAIIRKRRRSEQLQEADLPAKLEYPTIDLESVNDETQVRKQLETLAKRKPDEFVNLLRTWLVDE